MSPEKDPYGLVGTTVQQRYSVDAFVGVGRFSAVYKGTQLETSSRVALKFLKVRHDLPTTQRPLLLSRMSDASGVLKDIAQHCPRFSEIQDVASVITAEGRWMPFMVQTWLDGASLESIVVGERARQDSPRTLEQAMELLAPVSDALAYAHARGVVHGGLSPRSVFVRETDGEEWCSVEVLDLGVAAMIEAAQACDHAFHASGSTLACFVPTYGAPEQFSKAYGQIGPWTDVFALALILVELVAGAQALGEGTDDQLEAASTFRAHRPTPRALLRDLGPYVEGVFERALSVKPHERYATVSSFWDALRAANRLSPKRSASMPFDPFERFDDVIERVSRTSVPAQSDPYLEVPDSEYEADMAFSASEPPEPPPESSDEPHPESYLPAMAHSVMPRHTPTSVHPRPRAARSLSVSTLARIATATVVIAGGSVAVVEVVDQMGESPNTSAPRAVAKAVPAEANPSAIAPAALMKAACPQGMVSVPGGQFSMGSEGGPAIERPTHLVTVSAYCIDANEVTAARYKKCSDDGQCKRLAKGNEWPGIESKERKAFDSLCTASSADRGQHPMNCVDWTAASTFCASQGARLPTEAEWELAARGSDGRKYAWGNDAPTSKRLNACGKECVAWGRAHGVKLDPTFDGDDGFATTAPVGSFIAGDSPWGIHDLAGNVGEWTSDFYADYGPNAQTDPRGPSSGNERTVRGGSSPRATFRGHGRADERSYAIGFRCAKTL